MDERATASGEAPGPEESEESEDAVRAALLDAWTAGAGAEAETVLEGSADIAVQEFSTEKPKNDGRVHLLMPVRHGRKQNWH